MLFKNLIFFNKNGESIDYSIEDDIIKFSIYFEETSINLPTNETIFIAQKFKDSNGNILYGKPHIPITYTSQEMIVKSDGDDFTLFTIDNNNDISTVESISLQLDNNSTDINTDPITTSSVSPDILRFDMMFISKDDGLKNGTIKLYYDNIIIAEITTYASFEKADDRLDILLGNMGYVIDNEVSKIFRETDINEPLPDHKYLNKKKKELLFEIENIDPYLSSYKGIINIIKFFGYYDIKVKEYWRNVENNKLLTTDVVLLEYDKLNTKNIRPGENWRKTPYFGLYYEIVKPSGDYDEYGIPLTETVAAYSTEEIIIKLFLLKKYLQDKNIGGIAKVVDIIGEIFTFHRFSINTWYDNSHGDYIEANVIPEIKISNTDGYIDDLRPILQNYNSCDLPRNYRPTDFDIHPLNHNCFIGYFNWYNQDNPEFLDIPFIPVGFFTTLHNSSIDIEIQDVQISFENINDNPLTVTIESIGRLRWYDVEWVITRKTTLDDNREFKQIIRGDVLNYQDVDLILPYDGSYTVTMKLYEYGGGISINTLHDVINVKLYEISPAFFFHYYDKSLQIVGTCDLPFEKIDTEINSVIHDNSTELISTNILQNRSLNIAEYINLNYDDTNLTGTLSPKISDFLKTKLYQLKYVRFKDMIYPSERLSTFGIEKVIANSTIQIGNGEISIQNNVNIHDLNHIINLLSNTSNTDIDNFEYHVVDPDNKGFIYFVSKLDGELGNTWVGTSSNVNIFKTFDDTTTFRTIGDFSGTDHKIGEINLKLSNTNIILYSFAIEGALKVSEIRVRKEYFKVPVGASIFMTPDDSRMSGRTKATWKIINTKRDEIILISDNLRNNYRFTEEGLYSIDLTVEDTNGNRKSILRENVIEITADGGYVL